MRFSHVLLFIPVILGSMIIVSCGSSSDSSNGQAAWYTDIDQTSTVSGALKMTSDTATGDAVCYRLNLPSGKYSISLSGLSTDCGVALYNYDASITSLDALSEQTAFSTIDNNADTTSEFSNITVTKGGYCYLVVYNNSEAANAVYTLTLGIGSTTGWYSDLKLGMINDGKIKKMDGTYNCNRAYKFSVATAGTYTFKLTSSTNSAVYIYKLDTTWYYIPSTASTVIKSANVGEGISGALDAGDYIVLVANLSETADDAYFLTASSGTSALKSPSSATADSAMNYTVTPSNSETGWELK